MSYNQFEVKIGCKHTAEFDETEMQIAFCKETHSSVLLFFFFLINSDLYYLCQS